MQKRGHSGLPQHLEEKQRHLAQHFAFPHFTVDTETAWLHCHTVKQQSGEGETPPPVGVVYSHRRYSRPLLVQLTGQEYMLAYQDGDDAVGFQCFGQTQRTEIEKALQAIELIYRHMPLLEDPHQIDLLECAFCQCFGIAVQPLPQQERRLFTRRERVAVMEVEGAATGNG